LKEAKMDTLALKPLEVTAPGDREVVVTRAFDARRALVWDCHTKPELVRRWMLGPDGWSMPVCEMDVRVGGKYRWRWKSDADGTEFGFFGVFREVDRPAKLVHTEGYDRGDLKVEGYPEDGDALVTLTFAETGKRTLLTVTMLFPSKEARDGAVGSGMTGGMEIGYKRLDGMLAAMA
jgi:uncharacterized protein YndB with AHSA1/START domain